MRHVANPPNPYESVHAEWLEEPPRATLDVYEEAAHSILSANDSPDLPFRWSVNPYRGCQHACSYCYARPYHEYLGYGAGTDFDTRLVVKTNAADLLDRAFRKRSWEGEAINFSGVTDCYQPLEAVYEVTRACLEVCLHHRNPAMVVTKAALVRRDGELLAEIHRCAGASVYVSIPFAEADTARAIEPQTPAPSRRFDTIRALADAGVPVGVFVAPIIPGLNDREIPEILERAAGAGAGWACYTALRLPESVQPVFFGRLRESLPLRAKRIENRVRDIRGGRLNDGRFGNRMSGEGVYWESIRRLFEVSARRAGLPTSSPIPKRRGTISSDAQLTFKF